MFPSLLPVSTERWHVKENVKLMLMERQLRELYISVCGSKETHFFHKRWESSRNYCWEVKFSQMNLMSPLFWNMNKECVSLKHIKFSPLAAISLRCGPMLTTQTFCLSGPWGLPCLFMVSNFFLTCLQQHQFIKSFLWPPYVISTVQHQPLHPQASLGSTTLLSLALSL